MGGLTSEQRIAARGRTSLASIAKTAERSNQPLRPATSFKLSLRNCRRTFKHFVRALGSPYEIGTTRCSTFDDATAPTTRLWEFKDFKIIISALARHRLKGGKRYRTSTFIGRVHDLISVYRRIQTDRDPYFDMTAQVTAAYEWARTQAQACGLRKARDERVQLLPTSIPKMVGVAYKAAGSLRGVLMFTLAVATLSCTGLRNNSLMRRTSNNRVPFSALPEKHRGLRWRDVRIWLKPLPEGNANDVVAYISPRFFKTKTRVGRGKHFPLFTTAYLGCSANLLLLLLLYLLAPDDIPSIDTLLDPAYTAGRSRMLPVPDHLLDRYVFAPSSGITWSVRHFNRLLRTVARELGFQGDPTTRSFRHMVAQRIFMKRECRVSTPSDVSQTD